MRILTALAVVAVALGLVGQPFVSGAQEGDAGDDLNEIIGGELTIETLTRLLACHEDDQIFWRIYEYDDASGGLEPLAAIGLTLDPYPAIHPASLVPLQPQTGIEGLYGWYVDTALVATVQLRTVAMAGYAPAALAACNAVLEAAQT